MTATDIRPRGLLYGIPVIGWIARDLARDPEGHIWYLVVILITLAILAVKTWGLVALALPAVFLTPVMFVILVLISVGK